MLLAEWIADYEATHEAKTSKGVELCANGKWLPRWSSLSDITTESAADYTRERLRVVTRKTVTKELSMLRVFLAWCEERQLGTAPDVREPPRRAVGVRSGTQREHAVVLSPEQIALVLEALPEMSERTHKGRRYRVRDFFVVLWETGLRPTTVQRLEVPLHYRRGAGELVITDRIDKNRHGRVLPLTQRAKDALERSMPDLGPIFGRRTHREALRKAAKAALGDELGQRVARYDFRHSRLTSWGERTTNLMGLQHLAGHASAATTAKYLHASKKAAEEVLEANSGYFVGAGTGKAGAKEGN